MKTHTQGTKREGWWREREKERGRKKEKKKERTKERKGERKRESGGVATTFVRLNSPRDHFRRFTITSQKGIA